MRWNKTSRHLNKILSTNILIWTGKNYTLLYFVWCIISTINRKYKHRSAGSCDVSKYAIDLTQIRFVYVSSTLSTSCHWRHWTRWWRLVIGVTELFVDVSLLTSPYTLLPSRYWRHWTRCWRHWTHYWRHWRHCWRHWARCWRLVIDVTEHVVDVSLLKSLNTLLMSCNWRHWTNFCATKRNV